MGVRREVLRFVGEDWERQGVEADAWILLRERPCLAFRHTGANEGAGVTAVRIHGSMAAQV